MPILNQYKVHSSLKKKVTWGKQGLIHRLAHLPPTRLAITDIDV